MDAIFRADPKAVKEAMAAEQEANAKSDHSELAIIWAYCYLWVAITLGLPGKHLCPKIFNVTINCFVRFFLFALDDLPKMIHLR
jgi:hypothetical protein